MHLDTTVLLERAQALDDSDRYAAAGSAPRLGTPGDRRRHRKWLHGLGRSERLRVESRCAAAAPEDIGKQRIYIEKRLRREISEGRETGIFSKIHSCREIIIELQLKLFLAASAGRANRRNRK